MEQIKISPLIVYSYPGLPISGSSQEIYCEFVIQQVANFTKTSVEEIKGKSRKIEIVRARHYSIAIIKNNTNLGVVQIGRLLLKDHSTIITSLRKINDYNDNPYFKKELSNFKEVENFVSKKWKEKTSN